MLNLTCRAPQWFGLSIMSLCLTITGCSGGSSGTVPAASLAHAGATSRVALPKSAAKLHATGALINAYSQVIAADNPVVFYPMSDQTSSMVDFGNNSVGGTYGSDVLHQAAGITTAATVGPAFPGGATYDPNGFASVPINALLQPAQASIEAWFVLQAHNDTSHDVPAIMYGTIGRGARYGLFIHGLGASGDCLEYQQRNVGGSNLTMCSGTHLKLGATYHVVVSSDGKTVSMYLNGVLDKVAAFTGSIDYTQFMTDGLQIGGANQAQVNAAVDFNGTIAQVAIYGTPLTQARVTAHFLTGQLVPLTTEPAVRADSFVDSIGVNAHFDNPYSIYATQYPAIKAQLLSSGIRHIREAVTFNNGAYVGEMNDLAASGVRGSYVTQSNLTQAQVQQWPGLVGASFEAYEPPNEQDDVGNPNWLPQLIAFQKNLYSWVKTDPQIAAMPVLAPAIVKLADFTQVGNLSAYLDEGNIHDYFSVFNPGTIGWGSYFPPYGNYGSIPYNVNLGKVISGNKPIVATETGYGTVAGNPLTLDYRAHLRYMTRLFFEQLNGGIARSYAYELMDEGGSAVFANFGLLDTNVQPKPAFTGIKSLIGALADPGAAFTTTPLTYNLSGFINNVHHTLMQKRNGQYVLAIWIEVPDWVTLNNAGGDIIVPSQAVTLTSAKSFSKADFATMDDNGNLSTAPISAWTGTAATVSITDKVSLITLTP